MLLSSKKHKAIALMTTIGVLLVLSTTGVTFVRLSIMERQSSQNYTDKVATRLYAFAGLDHAIAVLIEEASEKGFNDIQDVPWRFPHDESVDIREAMSENFPLDPGQGTGVSIEEGIALAIRYSGLLKESDFTLDSYSLKIIDTSTQINLNSHIALPQSGVPGNQQPSNVTLNRIVRNLAVNCGFSGVDATTIADALIDVNFAPFYTDITQPLPRRWQSMEDVLSVINSLPLSVSTVDEQRFINRITTDSWVDDRTSRAININPNTDAIPTFVGEARSPININLASREVLSSVLQGLQAAPVIIDNSAIVRQSSNEGSVSSGDIFDETNIESLPVRITLNLIPDKAAADAIADQIISFRALRPFKNWNGLYKFIDGQLTVGVELPLDADIIERLHPNPTSPEITDQNLGTTIWEQICRDALKANFNPNNVDNRFNPNNNAFLRVTKGDLFSNTTLQGSHTTEFSFSSMGVYEITSLGQMAHANLGIVAQTIIESNVSIMEILQHTTQRDFEDTTLVSPSFSNTTSFPAVIKNLNWQPEEHVGRIEPEVRSTTPAGALFTSNFAVSRAGTPTLPNSSSQRFLTFPGGLQDMSIGTNIRDPQNNIVNDGIFSDIRQVSDPAQLRYHSVPAMPAGVVRGENTTAGAQISYYQGTMEFWVKLTESSNTQLGSALVSATFINPNPPYNPEEGDLTNQANSEGVQFYIFKNTLGELRFSRLYFCITFDESQNPIGTHFTTNADGWDIPNDVWQPQRLANGFRFPIPRQDVVVRANDLNWEAHTWHHIVVSWSNINPDTPLQITIDGEEKETAIQNIDFTPGNLDDPEFCLLNERAPRDCFNIGGFFRPQVDAARGLFKFANNVHFSANGTISNIRTFANPGTVVELNNRFENTASFTHTFVIPRKSSLGTLHWSSYPDKSDNGASVNVTTTIKNAAGNTVANFTEPTDIDTAGFDGDGLPMDSTNVEEGFQVEYTVDFNKSGNDVPVLDDVQLRIIRVAFLEIKEVL
ncbi:hypothetical protein [Candidatus Uabimicrobium amorphum]|uniref:Uncharacterized protein n=1 Tax=Uabimicrobium amorphum TaxID=2596890 RepID=A0A5S9ITX4_UABAM|nr:hypothetical protein [Candidatus Uabimicrobium amorphum]BBM88063.1 hypothetical protein UABAM_06479 [Candidatus Uabimicrobium amorphum]